MNTSDQASATDEERLALKNYKQFLWPNPTDIPLYVSIERASNIAGVSYETMSAWANDQADPIPHIRVGRAKKLIRTAALPEYCRRKESR